MMKLASLSRGQKARILHLDAPETAVQKLIALGFEEGVELTILHEGPFGRDPIAVELQDRCIALRRVDALMIKVEAL